jgi:hypothetical protein
VRAGSVSRASFGARRHGAERRVWRAPSPLSTTHAPDPVWTTHEVGAEARCQALAIPASSFSIWLVAADAHRFCRYSQRCRLTRNALTVSHGAWGRSRDLASRAELSASVLEVPGLRAHRLRGRLLASGFFLFAETLRA